MASELNQYPGRVKIKSVKLAKPDRGVDLTAFFLEFNTDVSLMDSNMDCELLVLDARNLLSNFPVTSGDRVQVSLEYLDTSKIIEFRIIRVERIVNDDKQRAYVLRGISELGFRSLWESCSGAFTGTFSDIALQVFKEGTHEEFGIWEESLGTTKVVIPEWDPQSTIRWCARKARAVNSDTRMKFFQDSKGVFHFTSVEKFIDFYKNNTPQVYNYFGNVEMRSSNGNQLPNSEGQMNQILDLEFQDSFDISFALTNGRLRGENYTWDYVEKKRETIVYDYWSTFNSKEYANKYPQWTREDYGGGTTYYSVFANDIHNKGINRPNDVSNIKQTNIDHSQKLNIVVKGNSSVDIGQLVELNIPAPEPINDEQVSKNDIRWSGKYYVLSKRDLYQKDGHQMSLELVKESQIMELMK